MPPRFARRRVFFSLLGAVALLVTVGWAVSRHYAFEARFDRSKPALEVYAAQAMASDPSKPLPTLPQQLGAFQTGNAERLPHGFLFFCDHGHPLDANGLAYSTQPPPDHANGPGHFKHLEGNWYTVWRP